ncbi:polysaccharide pyruvyl transferase family protein [Colwellia sp. 1_MG-2023]|uniref:polysaccharide pyruvyl transferase family protein n=1 Tax=Colwellia sp. 1_MG-2023 TaxID=3062649 RepID=UPI0026E32E14|nr:polysaccharide pyruvyl transferase family protein [Colwellia sp. 1_MG-2023]MDO6444323.1 polysaccharide pyruvyl transferase family protein [Colwellia sp. 1_MG-2023]
MLIEIKGVQFVNKGAELMLMAMVEKIHQLWPEAEVCLLPRINSPYKNRAKLGTYQKLNLRKGTIDLNKLSYFLPIKMRQYLKRAWGIVTEVDVDVILDASGFSYGDQWSDTALIQAAKEAKRLNNNSKKYVFMPQALGPFTSNNNQKWSKIAFENAQLIFARDDVSFQATQKVTSNSNLFISPDFTNLLSPHLHNDYADLKGRVAVIPNSKMLSQQNKNKVWRENYLNVLTNIIELLTKQGKHVFLLNHEGKSDEAICHQINQALKKELPIISPADSLQVKAIIGQCSLTICSRFHGCVSSLSQGVPCITTSWSHKYEQLFSEYGVSNLLLAATIEKEELISLVNYVIEEQTEIKNILLPNISKFKQEASDMWNKIYNNITA